MLKKLVAVFLILLIIFPCSITATGYDKEIKVGLFYDGSGKKSTALSCEGGIDVYGEVNKSLTYLFRDEEATALNVVMDIDGMYHIRIGDYVADYGSAKALAKTFSESGTLFYPAVIDKNYCILTGFFGSVEEASAEADRISQVLGIAATVLEPLYNSYAIKNQSSGETFFLYASSGENLCIKSANAITLLIEGKRYRGSAVFQLYGSTTNVINLVNLEEYLYSVVGQEMSPSWPIESLKAQAVCARSYALRNYTRYDKYGFDLDSTVASQAYPGYNSEDPNVIRAVDETKGQILTYNGELAEPLYFSTSGGSTENAENVWGGKVPYLVSVEDPYEPTDLPSKANWRVTLSVAEIEGILKNKGVDIGELTDITILSNTPSGRVLDIKLSGTNGEKIYSKDGARTFLSGRLYSQMYYVEKPVGSIYVLNGENKVSEVSGSTYVISGSGNVEKAENPFVLTKNGTEQLSGASASEYTFVGKGYGHGVGMSQWGAHGMAKAGFTYDQILTHYYTGTTISNI